MICVLALSTFFIAALYGCGRAEKSDKPSELNEPYLVEDESFLHGFQIIEDTVVYSCYLTLYNPEPDPVTVEMIGNFTVDYKRGLITENPLLAFSADDPPVSEFVLKPGENSFDILFAAPHGSAETKSNRLLPKIEIVCVDQ